MRHKLILSIAFLIASLPAAAEQSQAYFTQGVQICKAFGADGFFVTDRLEELGWVASYSNYYETTVLYTPGRSVWVIAPEEGAAMPTSCTIISDTVTIMQAEASVQHVVSDANAKYQLLSYNGCSEFDFYGSEKIRIWSNGQDDFCNDPNSARVEVITLKNPIANQ